MFKPIAAALALALAGGCASGPFAGPGPARSDELFSRIDSGMTKEEVRRLIGPPDDAMPFPLSHTEAWDYLYHDTWGYLAEFSVTFDAGGRALSKMSRRINVGGDHSP